MHIYICICAYIYTKIRLLEAMGGATGIVECTMVENNLTEAPFFSTPCLLGPAGIEQVIPFGKDMFYLKKIFSK
jgi:malate dehydrogenase